jgi:GAF domain-containing protein
MDVRRTRQRAALKIIRLSRQGLDTVSLWRACTPVLADAVPHYQTPCCYTVDPASRLITSHFQEGLAEFPPEWAAQEYATDDVNHIADVARSAAGISTLHQATNGDPSRSPRWRANIAFGGDQEMIAALRTRGSQLWGALGLYREPDRPLFDAEEMAFVQTIAPALADGCAEHCWLERHPIPKRLTPLGWSSSMKTGSQSLFRLASSGG